MKRLFDKNEHFTEAGNQVARDFETKLRDVIKEWEGFSYRDIEAILISSVTLIMAEMRIRADIERRKKK